MVELVAIIGLGVILLVAVALLFGPKPRREMPEAESEQDQADRAIVDIAPPGSGGG